MSYNGKEDIKQIKMSSGDEILCEIVDINDDELIIRNALQICKVDVDATRTYGMLRPWISFQETTQELISLNDMHIVAIALPSNDLMKQFANAIGEEQMAAISKDGEMTSGEEFDVETWMDRLYNKKGGVEKNIQFHEMFDSDENVIRFPSGYKH